MSDGIVVVGAGQAGAWVARTLCDEGYSGPITVLGAEPFEPYERPPLSKGLLTAEATFEDCRILDVDGFTERGIIFRPNVSVCAVRADQRLVACSDGTEQRYDELVLCMGGRARGLPMLPVNRRTIFEVRTLADAVALERVLRDGGRKVVIVGGGWIGLEVAATAIGLGHAVTVVEAGSRLCARAVVPVLSDALLARHRQRGVSIVLGVQAISADLGADRIALNLSNGTTLEADIVVVGIGLDANDELARDAGLLCDNGVVVDPRGRTSDDHIFAAGDVTALDSPRLGRRIRLQSWHNAQNQAISTARVMVGQDIHYDPVPMMWSDQFGALINMAGWSELALRSYRRGSHEQQTLIGVDHRNVAVFAAAIGDPRAYRGLSRLVERGAVIGAAELDGYTLVDTQEVTT